MDAGQATGGVSTNGGDAMGPPPPGTHVKAEPSLGAAALERVVIAAKAAHEEQQRSAEDQRAVCDLCNVRRADLRGPCGHKYHAREFLFELEVDVCVGGGWVVSAGCGVGSICSGMAVFRSPISGQHSTTTRILGPGYKTTKAMTTVVVYGVSAPFG